ncbi:MAG: lytic transglycosylase domain-containing protein [Deltaproteobacteria bacterium]|nr:lytic transglycosylase domain-containing protein [Deltaproteobacteria bacterium]
MTAVTDSGHRGTAAQRLGATIMRAAHANGLDPLLLVAIIQVESEFDVMALSKRGARGLMQIMPATGKWLADRLGQPLPSTDELYDVDLNVLLATRYLAELRSQFGSMEHALLAYNAGPTAARAILSDPDRRARWLKGYPAKVQRCFKALQASQASEIETPPGATDTTATATRCEAAECARTAGSQSERALRNLVRRQGLRWAVNSAVFPGPHPRRRFAWPGTPSG